MRLRASKQVLLVVLLQMSALALSPPSHAGPAAFTGKLALGGTMSLIGGAVLGLVGYVLGFAVAVDCTDDVKCTVKEGVAERVGAVGLITGSALGAAAGVHWAGKTADDSSKFGYTLLGAAAGAVGGFYFVQERFNDPAADLYWVGTAAGATLLGALTYNLFSKKGLFAENEARSMPLLFVSREGLSVRSPGVKVAPVLRHKQVQIQATVSLLEIQLI